MPDGAKPAPQKPAAVDTVTSCADDGSVGTLRYEINNAPSGALIDLSTLACSTITLDGSWPASELQVMQYSLYLKGPGDRHLTIDGGGHSSVLRHLGSGTLGITDLAIANGYYVGSQPNGGCIYSAGNVALVRSVVSNCTVGGNSTSARGGGILTKGNLTLTSSTVTNSRAVGTGPMAVGDGGGVFVFGDFRADYSTLSDNGAYAKYANTESVAGAVHALSNVTIAGSTISGNRADLVGGIGIEGGPGHAAIVTNSTVSSNTASLRFGGLWTNVALKLSNTTIAFNSAFASGSFPGAGLYFTWPATLQSSIIAANRSEAGPSDVGASSAVTITGTSSNNLIVASNVSPPNDTIRDCPRLQPLANNGGPTLTHALSQASPAIENGNNSAGLVTDQRFESRVASAWTDIGAVEWQPGETDERVFVNGFDGVCDR